MADNVENLMLEHLKRFQTSLDRMERKLDEHTKPLANLETGQALIVQHIAHLASADAAQQLSIDTSIFDWVGSSGGSSRPTEFR